MYHFTQKIHIFSADVFNKKTRHVNPISFLFIPLIVCDFFKQVAKISNKSKTLIPANDPEGS